MAAAQPQNQRKHPVPHLEKRWGLARGDDASSSHVSTLMTKHLKRAHGIVLAALVLGIFTGSLLAPATTSAHVEATILSGLYATGEAAEYSTILDLPTLIGNIIQALLGATGIIFLGITIYAGLLYMTAAGDDTKVKKAKSMLSTSVIGLLIVIGAYAITEFIINQIYLANIS